MICKTCFGSSPVNKDVPSRFGACDVCTTVNGNQHPKPTIYCKLCNAWICEACKADVAKRGFAALIVGFEKVFNWFN